MNTKGVIEEIEVIKDLVIVSSYDGEDSAEAIKKLDDLIFKLERESW